MSDQKEIVWLENGVPHYTASSLGSCLRSLVAARLGYEAAPPPDKLQKIYDAGHSAEDLCFMRLRQDGWMVTREQETVCLPIVTTRGPVIVQGHIDAVVFPPDTARGPGAGIWEIAEVKSQGPSAWEEYERTGGWRADLRDHYEWQISPYMIALGLPLRFVRWKRGAPGELDPGIYALEEVMRPPYSAEQVASRLSEIEEYAERFELPPCPDEQWGCPFYYLHEGNKEPQKPAIKVPGLAELARRYDHLRSEEAHFRSAKEEVREQIRELLSKHDATRAMEDNAYTVLSSGTKRYLDEQAMLADGIDLDKYRREKPFSQLRVTYKKQETL